MEEKIEFHFKKKPIYSFFKRFFDIILSLLGIIILSWLFLLIAIIIKCTSKGPVFYVSWRIGKNMKPFRIYKFRSMVDGAEKDLEKYLERSDRIGTFKLKDDPRITKFGKFLRKTSLDELPQFFNILNGTMTIVGPRPCVEREMQAMNELEKNRFLVPQGLTCIWQVSGRANKSFAEQLNMDLKYVMKRGFFYDIWLIIKTIPAVLFGKGAE